LNLGFTPNELLNPQSIVYVSYHACNSVVIVVKLCTMDMLGNINYELNYSDVSEVHVTEDCLSNEADQTTVNRHTNCMLQLTLFKMSVQT